MKRVTILLLLFMFIIPATVFAQEEATTPAELCAAAYPAPEPETREFEQAEQVLKEGVDYHAVLCTSDGPIYVDLFEEQTPMTVNNFVFLAQQGYYNNTNFHRVIQDFMAQAGDPSNTGAGGPGYEFEDEIVEGLVFDRPGLLAMANAGPGTNGSQFFITTVPTDWLNGAHTIFGEVLAGQANVENIDLRDPQQAISPGTMLYTIVIVENPENVPVAEEELTTPTREEVETAVENAKSFGPTVLERFFPTLELLELDETRTIILTTEEVTAMAGETLGAYYTDHNHQYTATGSVLNTTCDIESFPVKEMSYRIDAYGTAEDASAALEDERLAQRFTEAGFEAQDTGDVEFAVYTRATTECEQDMSEVAGVWQQGNFVVTAQLIVTPDLAEFGGLLIIELVRPFFEQAFYPVLRN